MAISLYNIYIKIKGVIILPYQVLLIDADHTLFDFDRSEEIAFLKMLEHIQLSDQFSNLYPIYYKENNDTWRDLEKGVITQTQLKTERFKRFLKATNLSADPLELSVIFTKHLSQASILYDDAFEIIKKLSKKYQILIVTNGLKEVQDTRVRHSILEPFVEATIISDEIGITKPDPRIIDYALKQVNHLRKEDIVIIGDGLLSDIKCGFNAHIDTIWYNPKKLKNHLDKKPTYTISKLSDLLLIL